MFCRGRCARERCSQFFEPGFKAFLCLCGGCAVDRRSICLETSRGSCGRSRRSGGCGSTRSCWAGAWDRHPIGHVQSAVPQCGRRGHDCATSGDGSTPRIMRILVFVLFGVGILAVRLAVCEMISVLTYIFCRLHALTKTGIL